MDDILNELFKILGPQKVTYSPDYKCTLECEVDSNKLASKEKLNDRRSVGKPLIVGLSIEIKSIPRMNMNIIQFKRTSGGVWSYKKVCHRVLSKLHI